MVMRKSLDKAIVRTSNQGSVDFDFFDQRERTLLHKLEEQFDNSAVLRVSSQLLAPGAASIRKRCVVVQTLPVRTSAQVEARYRRWFRCPPLYQRAGLVLAQLHVSAP